ncbi:hypothetical protein L484_014395 [Morus notabilis]|uniref:Uncharacterized protein n=1 Tax=Morus notabilis TaxID=981085 RepID=W9RVX2_9ROSA|nr:hypothetical protein L484_014395 [Morus notabilis]
MASKPSHPSKKGSAVAEGGSAAAIAGMRRRPHAKSQWADSSRPRVETNYVLSFYTDDSEGFFKLSRKGVIVMCFCFIGFICALHIIDKRFRSKSAPGQF